MTLKEESSQYLLVQHYVVDLFLNWCTDVHTWLSDDTLYHLTVCSKEQRLIKLSFFVEPEEVERLVSYLRMVSQELPDIRIVSSYCAIPEVVAIETIVTLSVVIERMEAVQLFSE